ncbi:MAG: 3D domain-containing protein [Acidobacteriota bacterium]
MKSLVRGAMALVMTGMFVMFIYAQTLDVATLAPANDSRIKIENNIDSSFIVQQDDDKKLVKTTASVRKVAAGASRGSFNATAYCLSGKTAMGHGVRRGIIAADPRVLKLGSKVTINAGPWSGTYLVSDTGGGIKGKRLDIWVPSCAEARRFGRRSIQVFAAE